MSRRRRALFWLLLGGALLAFIEVASALLLVFVERAFHWRYAPVDALSEHQRATLERVVAGDSQYIVPDAQLGWTIRSNGRAGDYRANTAGMRRDDEVGRDPPPGYVRIAAFGDSFTHGDKVRHADSWAARLEATAEGVQVLNFGVSGYGVDQAFLRYQRMAGRFPSDVVLIGLIPRNLYRHVNRFRPFYAPGTGLVFGKPRFRLQRGADGEQLELLPNPLPDIAAFSGLLARPGEELARIGAGDFFYPRRYRGHPLDGSPTFRLARLIGFALSSEHPHRAIAEAGDYRPDSEALRVTGAVLEAFRDAVCAQGAQPLIVLLPTMEDVVFHRRTGRRGYQPLLDAFTARALPVVDLMPAKLNDELGVLYEGHPTPLGHRRIAEHLHHALLERGLLPRADAPGRTCAVSPG